MRRLIQRLGLGPNKDKSDAERLPKLVPEADAQARADILRVRPYTMTSLERLWAMYAAVRHVSEAGLEGDIVECGVWRGGNLILAGLGCQRFGLDRTIYGFDTYAGMSEPTDKDVTFSGASAWGKFRNRKRADHVDWCYASLDEVRANVAANTSYGNYRLIPGKCEETLKDPANLPDKICVLRLDTDWYESTRAELEVLYPRLVPGGVLILDDYGHWGGAREATDEYFSGKPVFMSRIDYTGRLMLKPAA